ncbi:MULTISPECIES: ABC transporter permease [unclassified Paenibacillus]|uniref:ABC transporter permease n=1 Tax=unclassified Paenibacillus TaxID=185978 RepID=UPI001C11634D|nr:MULTISPECIES: ABC transporter permease [unclassified Paenibacillus]MBU5441183.1 ABC transporter permease [Paenibacillus sp. MSJ-34]CAH0120492.1 hypothetical protein PAE9249_03011 [Paenibacillus sp. CECT 9249]
MNSTGTFWALVRHEFKWKGSRRKQQRPSVAKWWWIVYLLLLVAIGIGATVYYALQDELRLGGLWFVTTGFPYMMFFFGFGTAKREWENETHGWWLTLPYSRLSLAGAKWFGAWLRTIAILVAAYAILSVYALFIAVTLGHHTLAEVGGFMVAGINWLILPAGFSPLIIALGMVTCLSQYSSLRPLTPLLWVVIMSGMSFIYWAPGFGWSDADNLLLSEGKAIWFPFSWIVPACMALSWLAAYLLVRLCAYILDRKLS